MFRSMLSAILVFAFLFGAVSAFAADTYEIDAVHSNYLFRVKHLGVSYTYGRFNESSGKFTIDSADSSKNSIEIEVKTDSIDTANAGRDKHLKGPDFFNTVEFPTMTFKSTSFKKKDDGKYDVTGDLTIHGVTKSVTASAEFVGSGKGMKGEQRAGWDATLVINRADFGMNYMPDGIGTEVTLTIAIEGIKK
ncbi:MAG: YceI family protein [Candidatus Hydrogenedentes bacterium]|nr:YceI family protein [Candidatus Hydrogenedentota bacterium]